MVCGNVGTISPVTGMRFLVAALLAALLCHCGALEWHRVATSNAPSSRHAFGIGYDPAGSQVVIFGGLPLNGETWLLDLTQRAWRRLEGAVAPEARFGMYSALDPLTRKFYVSCGQARTIKYDTRCWGKVLVFVRSFDGWWDRHIHSTCF
jgi:hypothetical protein